MGCNSKTSSKPHYDVPHRKLNIIFASFLLVGNAVIIFSSWYYRLKDISQLVKIPAAQTVYRGTPIAVTAITDQKQDAEKVIQFLLIKEGHAVFKKWGWE